MPQFRRLMVACLVALKIFAAPVAEARQICRLPSEVDALIVSLQLTLSTEGALSPLQQTRLAGLGGAIDRTAIEKELRKADLQSSQNALSTVIDSAQQIAADGFVADRGLVESQLKEALGLVRSLCAERANRIDQQLTRVGIVRQLEEQAGTQRRLPSPLGVPDNGSLSILLLLAPLVLAVTVAIILCRRAYDWARTFAFSRRSCHVAAAVEHDLDIIDGHILVIGRRSVKFKPVNEDDYQRLADLGEGEYLNLIVGHHCLPGQVEGLHGDFAIFFFSNPIRHDFIEILLRSSSIRPRYVRTLRPRRKKQSRDRNPDKASFLKPAGGR